MATRLYLPKDNVAAVSPAVDATWTSSTGVDRIRCRRTVSGSLMTSKTVTRPLGSGTYYFVTRQYVSDPISAQTITGTVKGQVRASENAAATDACIAMSIRVVSNDGSTFRGTLYSDFPAGLANELPTALTNHYFPASAAVSSVTASANDRLVIEYGIAFFGASGTRRGVMNFGSDGFFDLAENETFLGPDNPWIEFSQDITFAATEVDEFVLAINAEGLPSLPATFQCTQTTTGTGDTKRTARRNRGGTAGGKQQTITDPGGGEVYYKHIASFSEPLLPQTISAGTWTVNLNCKISASGAGTQTFYAYLYVWLANNTKGAEIGTAGPATGPGTSYAVKTATLSGASAVTIAQGDRIGCEILWYDDGGNAYPYDFFSQAGTAAYQSVLIPPSSVKIASRGVSYKVATADFDSTAGDVFFDKFVSPLTAQQTISTKISMKNATGVSKKVTTSIYSNTISSGVDVPYQKVVDGVEVDVANGTDGEVTFTFASTGLSTGTKYWIAHQYEGVFTIYYTATDTPQKSAWTSGAYGTWPADASGATTFDTTIDYAYLLFGDVPSTAIKDLIQGGIIPFAR